MLNSKESKNKRTKKTIQLLFIVVAVFVVITAAVIIGIMLYNFYPTKPGGQEWFMNMRDIAHDPRTLFTAAIPTVIKNPDGSWKVSSP